MSQEPPTLPRSQGISALAIRRELTPAVCRSRTVSAIKVCDGNCLTLALTDDDRVWLRLRTPALQRVYNPGRFRPDPDTLQPDEDELVPPEEPSVFELLMKHLW